MNKIIQTLKSMTERREFYIPALITVLGLAFRLWLMRYHFAAVWDEPHYLQLAGMFRSGSLMGGLHPYWSPLYPAWVACVSLFVPDLVLAGRIASVLAGTAVIPLIYMFGRRLFGRQAAAAGTLLLALSPTLAFSSSDALAEPLYLILSLTGIYCGWTALQKERFLPALAAGIFFCLAYLAKVEGIGFFIIYSGAAFTWAFFDLIRKKGTRRFILTVVTGAAFVILSLPYLIYLHGQTGQWTLSAKIFSVQQFEAKDFQKTDVDYGKLSQDNTVLPLDAIYHQGNFLNLVKEKRQSTRTINLPILIKKYLTNFYRLEQRALPSLLGGFFLFLFILGIVGGKGESRERGLQLYLLAFIFGFWFFFVPLFHISERYLLAGFLPAFIWIGRGFILLKSQLEERLSRPAKSRLSFLPPGKGALLVLILIWGVLVFLPELGRVVKRDKWSSGIFDDAVELKQAGEWIRENGKKNPVLMTQMKSVDFYAGVFDVRKGVSFSEDNLERNLAYARCRRVDYLVVTSRYSERYPQLEPLFEKDNPLPELKLVHAERTPQDIEMRIFVLLK